MILFQFTILLAFALNIRAQANITIQPLTNVNEQEHTGYFSDPYHVPYKNETRVYISGTTHKYLECDGELTPKCATLKNIQNIQWNVTTELQQELDKAKVQVCGVAGIHPFQTVSDNKKSWDAAVTLHVQENSTECHGLKGWSVIVHATPAGSTVDTPPHAWTGDKVLVGSFSDNVDANYDGKYFRTPEGKLFLVYQQNLHKKPLKRDGVVAWPMKDPTTPATPNQNATVLLAPDEGLNSENYHNHSDNNFKLIETGNIRAINGKFLMAYSVGAYNRPTYKLAVAYSDTFLPENDGQYRKVMKENPDELWGSEKQKEVYYLLQADAQHDGWHYVGNQVRAPGVPTVAKIGAGDSWVLTFAGYEVGDTGGNGTLDYVAKFRRPFFIDLDVNVPTNTSVKEASDQDLQGWITPKHG
ncbi:hypothetical protein J7T55_003292 [Diaporthe amygdali]|uniref:uncharacterized protein n=1 Tax=Phomopsis amygdali TaxID=1214568 RepID=UPI0022FF3BBC|nr:uncharacterized protein J7T55_003292 [Diaporthe amygdali]KAJ0122776.1 hypothetical protein J7T55_003292 [Diaporthe amygdali]